METQVRIRLLSLLVVAALSVLVWTPHWGGAGEIVRQSNSHLLQVHFLDVGQGDAVFIETPDGVQVIIDGGRDSAVIRELGAVLDFADRTIDVMIATHPDSDHIGGLIDVLERYQIASVIQTEQIGDSPAAVAFQTAVQAENAVVHTPRTGEVIQLGASTTLEILFPPLDASAFESNTASVIAQLRYGDTEFMLTGDAPQSIETYLVGAYGADLRSDVLKVGHHGSKTSTAPEFLAAVAPTHAVISAGVDNSYGHPHPEVMNRLRAANLAISQTAETGTITFYSDGQRVWIE